MVVKQDLGRAKTYEHLLNERYVVDRNRCNMAAMVDVFVDENYNKFPSYSKPVHDISNNVSF